MAREYGLPAVISVPDATTGLREGQSVRVDGTRGTVESLDAADDLDGTDPFVDDAGIPSRTRS